MASKYATGSRFCECGNAKAPMTIQCRRCGFLDGSGRAQRAVIDALNDLDGATVAEIAAAADALENSVEVAVKALHDKGRVARRWSEDLGAYVHWAVLP